MTDVTLTDDERRAVLLALAHVEITQARMETLLARMIPQSENGRKA